MLIQILFVFFLGLIFSTVTFTGFPSKIIWFYLLIIVVIIVTFRDGNYLPDYVNYKKMFYSEKYGVTEVAFIFFTNITKFLFGNNVYFLFFIFAFFAISIKFYIIKKESLVPYLSLLLYFSYSLIFHEMIQIRAGLCVAFGILGLVSLAHGKILNYIFLCFLAFFTHYSGALFFIFIVLNSIKLSSKWMLVIPLLYFFYFLNAKVTEILLYIPVLNIQSKINGYLNNNVSYVNVFSFSVLIRIVFIYFMFYKSNWKKMSSVNQLFLKTDIISISLLILFSDFPVFSFRTSQLFGSVEFLLLPTIRNSFKQKKIIDSLLIFYSFFLLFRTLSASNINIF